MISVCVMAPTRLFISARRLAFCVPPPCPRSNFCATVSVWRRISHERFAFCVPPPSARSIFGATVHVLRRISDERFVFCVGGDEFLTNGSRFASCYLFQEDIGTLRRLSDQYLEVGPNWSHLRFKSRGQRFAGWGFAGKDRRLRFAERHAMHQSQPDTVAELCALLTGSLCV